MDQKRTILDKIRDLHQCAEDCTKNISTISDRKSAILEKIRDLHHQHTELYTTTISRTAGASCQDCKSKTDILQKSCELHFPSWNFREFWPSPRIKSQNVNIISIQLEQLETSQKSLKQSELILQTAHKSLTHSMSRWQEWKTNTEEKEKENQNELNNVISCEQKYEHKELNVTEKVTEPTTPITTDCKFSSMNGITAFNQKETALCPDTYQTNRPDAAAEILEFKESFANFISVEQKQQQQQQNVDVNPFENQKTSEENKDQKLFETPIIIENTDNDNNYNNNKSNNNKIADIQHTEKSEDEIKKIMTMQTIPTFGITFGYGDNEEEEEEKDEKVEKNKSSVIYDDTEEEEQEKEKIQETKNKRHNFYINLASDCSSSSSPKSPLLQSPPVHFEINLESP